MEDAKDFIRNQSAGYNNCVWIIAAAVGAIILIFV